MGELASWAKKGLLAFLVLAVAIQLVPYGRDHSNPAVGTEPVWDTPQTRELAVRACFDCHSNETVWPWYSNIAPISWMIQNEVNEGRDELNFSEWHLEQEGDDAAESLREDEMPPGRYLWTHPDARLTDDELAALEAGLIATFGEDEDEEDEDEEDEEEEDEEEEEEDEEDD